MITLTNIDKFNNTLNFTGLSTDTMPTKMYKNKYKVINASTFYTMDTQSVYMFDEENNKWVAQA